MPTTSPARLLLVRLGAVGDVVRTLPLLRALRAAHPGCRIGWAVEEPAAGLLGEIDGIDRVHVLERRRIARLFRRPPGWPQALRLLRQFVRDLRGERYDIALDAHGTLKAALVTRLAGAGTSIGFAAGGSKEGASLLYSRALSFPAEPWSRVRRALYLGHASGLLPDAAPAGASPSAPVDFGLRFAPERARLAKDFIASLPGAGNSPLVTLFPFASAAGQDKRWPLERHVAVAGALAAGGARVALLWGSPREGEQASTALAAAGQSASGVRLAPATDLVQLTEILRRVDLLITGDTGPMHLAAGVGTPVLALFGPTDPVVNWPWGEGHEVLVRQPLSALSVEEVLARSRQLLGLD